VSVFPTSTATAPCTTPNCCTSGCASRLACWQRWRLACLPSTGEPPLSAADQQCVSSSRPRSSLELTDAGLSRPPPGPFSGKQPPAGSWRLAGTAGTGICRAACRGLF
jgi:hypothetical protein